MDVGPSLLPRKKSFAAFENCFLGAKFPEVGEPVHLFAILFK